jgi:RNA polymerase sigma-B factor
MVAVARTVTEPRAVRTWVPRPADHQRGQRTRNLLAEARVATNVLVKQACLEKAVLLNMPIADRLARRYSGRGVPTQDLIQVARLGLINAVHGFDPDAGHDFLSYAVPTIVGELKRHFRDRGWTVRPPRRIQELRPRIVAASSTLTQTLGRTPARADVATFLDIDEVCVVEALAADGCFNPASLDRSAGGDPGNSSTLGNTLAQTDPGLAMVEARLALAPLFRSLGNRDRLILRLRSVDGLTQRDIGRIVGLSQMQVSRILTRILRLARDELAK